MQHPPPFSPYDPKIGVSMKSTSLSLVAAATAVLALPAMVAAQAPVVATPAQAPAPVVAPVAYAAATTGPAAPVSPATNTMIQNNIALTGGINAMSYVPHKYADKSFASFQWAGGNNAQAWAAFDSWAVSFRTSQDSVRGALVNSNHLAGYWLTPDLGLSATISLNRTRTVTDVTVDPAPDTEVHAVITEDTVLAFDGIELGASVPRGDMHLYAALRARSLGSGDSTLEVEFDGPASDTSFDHSFSSRNYRAGFTIGARTYASPNGSAWQAQLSYDYDHLRASGEDEASYVHRIRLSGRWGQRKDIDGYAIAYGINPVLSHVDAKAAPDVRDTLLLPPNVAIEIPLFQNWTLKGGATLPLVMVYDDAIVADDEGSVWSLNTTAPTGNVGVRYGRSRWAAEAVVSSAFLNNGPYFLTGNNGAVGAAPATSTLAQFALVVNFD